MGMAIFQNNFTKNKCLPSFDPWIIMCWHLFYDNVPQLWVHKRITWEALKMQISIQNSWSWKGFLRQTDPSLTLEAACFLTYIKGNWSSNKLIVKGYSYQMRGVMGTYIFCLPSNPCSVSMFCSHSTWQHISCERFAVSWW